MKSIIFNILIMGAFFVLFTYYPNASHDLLASSKQMANKVVEKANPITDNVTHIQEQHIPEQKPQEQQFAKTPEIKQEIKDDIIEENIATLDAKAIPEKIDTQEVALFDDLSSQQPSQQQVKPQFMSNQDRAVELHNLAQEMEFVFIDRVQ